MCVGEKKPKVAAVCATGNPHCRNRNPANSQIFLPRIGTAGFEENHQHRDAEHASYRSKYPQCTTERSCGVSSAPDLRQPVADVLNSLKERTVLRTPEFQRETIRRRNSWTLYVGLIYTFGKPTKKTKDDALQ
jgi:hypothetical protein